MIGTYWSGVLTEQNVRDIAVAIRMRFDKRLFSTMTYDSYQQRTLTEEHKTLDTIKPALDGSNTYLYILSRNQWSIQYGSFVCLTEKMLVVEYRMSDGSSDSWCWVLED